jgi:hypothetical protein
LRGKVLEERVEFRNKRPFTVRVLKPAAHTKKSTRALAKMTGRYRSAPFKRGSPDREGECKWCRLSFAPGDARLIQVTESGRIRDCCVPCGQEHGYKVVRREKGPKRHREASPAQLARLAERFGNQ